MAVKEKIKSYAEASLSELTEEQRRGYIESLEADRDFTVSELEELMRTLAKLTGKRSLKIRRYKLGRSPNDRRA